MNKELQERAAPSRRKNPAWILFLFSFGFLVFFINSNNTNSFNLQQMGIESIVERGRVYLEGSPVPQLQPMGDTFLYKGHTYAAKQPGQFILGAAIYFVLNKLGVSYKADFEVTGGLITLFTSCLMTALIIVMVYFAVSRIVKDERNSLIIALFAGFGTILFPYSGVSHHDVMGVFFAFSSFYVLFYVYRMRPDTGSGLRRMALMVLAGFLGGLTFFFSLLPLGPVIALCLYVLFFRRPGDIVAFLLSFIAGLLPVFAFNWVVFGGPINFPNIVGNFSDTVPHFSVKEILKHLYFYALSPSNSILFYSPVFVASLLGLFLLPRDYLYEKWALLLSFFLLLFHVSAMGTVGHAQFGPRYLLPSMPFGIIGLCGYFMKDEAGGFRFSRAARGVIMALGFISVIICAAGSTEGVMYNDIGVHAFPVYLRKIFNGELPVFHFAKTGMAIAAFAFAITILRAIRGRLSGAVGQSASGLHETTARPESPGPHEFNPGADVNEFISKRKMPFDKLGVPGHGEPVEQSQRANSLTKTFPLMNKKAVAVILLALFMAAFCAIAYTSQKTLQNFPNSADEYAYIFQARNLARLQVYAPVHPSAADGYRLQNYFYFVHIGETDGKYYGRFPFGYSLLLVPAAWLELFFKIDTYWMVNAMFGSLTIVLIFLIASRFLSFGASLAASIIGLCNPWFIFTSASFFSHTSCAFFIGLSLYLLLLAVDENDDKTSNEAIFFSGACLGFSMLIRFLDPLAFLLPFLLIYVLFVKKKNALNAGKALHKGIYFFAGTAFFIIVLLLYNKALTGHFFMTAYEYFNPVDSGTRFIFMQIRDGRDYVDLGRIYSIGLKEMTLSNMRLLFDWFKWAYALILLPLAFLLYRKEYVLIMTVSGIVLICLLEILLYALYGGPAMNQYGPRYFYSLLVPLSILSSFAIFGVTGGRFRALSWAAVAAVALMSLVSVSDKSREIYADILDRRDLYRAVEHYRIHNAVVFLKTNSGSMYKGDLTRNDLDFGNDVIYAQDLDGNYAPLMRYYRGRNFFEYRYQGNGSPGSLTPLGNN